jgi:TatD DNase family protein
MPFRGKVNTPANVPWVARRLAEIKGTTVEAIADRTSRNFERLFLGGNVPRTSGGT